MSMISRRDALKISGAALGGVAFGGGLLLPRGTANAGTGRIRQRKAATLDFGSSPLTQFDPDKTLAPPKYADVDGHPDPYAQLDRREEYQPSDGYCDSGY